MKLRWSELRQAIAELALDIAGEEALLARDARALDGAELRPDEQDILAVAPRYLNSRAYSIMGGTSEIQTSVLAKLMLGL